MSRYFCKSWRDLRRFLRCRLLAVLVVSLGVINLWSAPVLGEELPVLKLSVLQFGTAHWELDHIQRLGLDRQAGYDLEVRLVPHLPASRIAVSSGDVQGAVADLLWVQARYDQGEPYLYLPFSSQIGDILVAEDARFESIDDLRGKRIGVAGGPDSKGWILLRRVAAEQGLDLEREAEVSYAAPPLLNEAMRRGRVDVLVTYWHFAAKLKAAGGVRTALQMADLLDALSLDRDLPVLGYVFRESWAREHRDLLDRFAGSLVEAKRQLAEQASRWEAIRPLMRVEGDADFEALRQGFVAGTPAALDDQRISDLQRLLVLTGAEADEVLPDRLFYRADASRRAP
ncbi:MULTISPECIES: ABC transporter substrate-binding protein [Halomonas]|uniref:ABC transporter substrate-binding protein n=1 Tax=Halomonas flagellata TaxID=2920385 RepID=A0ABS9RRI7_9GAMM|nr:MULTISPECIES: ABC transporter substrate-binding protein [Halomonas]MCH4562473.1 ABC transporter substrate-binding protein [Halomonas flagellata]PXY00029.1 ABC transporter substrate-binding protein [Halomonas sp. LBP4]